MTQRDTYLLGCLTEWQPLTRNRIPNSTRQAGRHLSLLAISVLLVVLIALPGIASADDYVGGIPLTTIQTGTVTGGLWFDATPAPDWGSQDVTKTFTLPANSPGNITWARLYISAYAGHMQDDKAFTITNKFDGNGDGTYEQTWPETGHAAFHYLVAQDDGISGNDNSAFSGHGASEPYKMINDHENRVTSDYFMWYDVTSMITGSTVNVNVNTVGSSDGRIKVITLVVAYNNASSTTETTYWVNQGHDVCSYYPEDNEGTVAIGTTSFATAGLSGITSATLTTDYMASNNGNYGFPTNDNDFVVYGSASTPPVEGTFTNLQLDRVADVQGAYSGVDSWDVTSSVTGSSATTLAYSRYFAGTGTAAFYKMPLAFLVVKSPRPAVTPVAAFNATPLSGTVPLAVTFNDQSTNTPTSWSWTFGDGSTSTEQNPVHEYTAAGNYTVALTAANTAGSDVEEKTGYVTVTSGGTGGLADSAWPKFHANAQNTGLSLYNGPQTGNLLWTYTAGTSLNVLGGSPVIGSDGTVYEGSYDGKLYAINPDGTLKWSYASGGRIYGSPAIGSDGTIYFGSFDYLLYALNPDGTLKWTYTTGGQIRGSPAIGPDGTIYVGSNDNKIYAINPDGSLRWSYTTGGYVQAYGGPAIGTDGTIYAGSDDNNLYAINADGTLKWSYTASSDLSSSPAIGTDGTVYIMAPLTVQFTDASTSLGSVGEERVANGDFETSDLTGWTVIDNGWETLIGGRSASMYSAMSSVPGAELTQAIDLTDVNALTFWYYAPSDIGEGTGVSVKIDGTTVYSGGNALGAWTQASIDTSAYTGTHTVSFFYTNENAYEVALDDISATSSTGISAWSWTFGDGSTSAEQSPAHEYTAAGTYTVTLTVTDANGSDSETKTGYVTVSPAVFTPVAAFTGTPTSGTAPLTVTFTDASTNEPTEWSWNFGDGDSTNATVQGPVHIYASAGTYTVNLTATNSAGSNTVSQAGYITVTAPVSKINLTFTGANGAATVNPYPAYIFAREPNTVQVKTIKNTGTETATNIVVALYASDVSSTVPVNTTTIASLAAGTTASTQSIIDPTVRDTADASVTYTAVIDPDNLIAETNETDNTRTSLAKTVLYNGYKGKGIYWAGGSNITTEHTFDLKGNVIYSTQPSSSYKGVGWTGRTETWAASDLSVPTGATIEKVYLYVSYNWDTTSGGAPSIATTFNGNTINLGTPYTDKSNFGAYANYVYGLYPAIDVTSLYSSSGNSLVMTPNSGNSNALYPSTLVVVYSDPTETRKQIFISEGCDEVLLSESSYGTNLTEATAYAEFSGMTIDTANIQSATLASFAGSAGPDEGNLLFNGQTLATNAWQGDSSSASAATFDVKNYLTATDNVAGIQGTTSGGMDALQQILVVEYPTTVTAPVAAFTGTPTSGTVPLEVTFTDASTNAPTSWLWDFGDSDSTNATVQNPVHTYAAAGNYTVTLTATNTGGNGTVTETDYITVTAAPAVIALPGQTSAPTDTDGDGLYEDLNGNSRKDYNDLQVYFANMPYFRSRRYAAGKGSPRVL